MPAKLVTTPPGPYGPPSRVSQTRYRTSPPREPSTVPPHRACPNAPLPAPSSAHQRPHRPPPLPTPRLPPPSARPAPPWPRHHPEISHPHPSPSHSPIESVALAADGYPATPPANDELLVRDTGSAALITWWLYASHVVSTPLRKPRSHARRRGAQLWEAPPTLDVAVATTWPPSTICARSAADARERQHRSSVGQCARARRT